MLPLLRLATALVGVSLRQTGRRVRTISILVLLAFIFLLIGLGGFIAALWIWAVPRVDPMTLALCMGAGGFVLAGILLLVARHRSRPRQLFLGSQPLGARQGLTDFTRKADPLMIWGPIAAVALAGFLLGRGGGKE